tara:strand:- start:61540 stop:61839 length:300 start_codon:yes stop_codon:yes gene_type:complete
MKHFYLDFIFTAIALAVAAWWGYSHGGMGGLITTLLITAILAIMEISLSFDNAVVNASVLKHWDEFWKKIFLTVGILLRYLVCVWCSRLLSLRLPQIST